MNKTTQRALNSMSKSTLARNPHLANLSPSTPFSVNVPNVAIREATPTERRMKQDHKPLMNKLESRFHQFLLRTHGQEHLLAQAVRFRLANGLWYKPDFVLWHSALGDTLAWEVKGPHSFRGGFENLKTAAKEYPMIVWTMVWWDGTAWVTQKVLQ